MSGFSISLLTRLTAALVTGDERAVERLVERGLEDAAEDLVKEAVASIFPGLGTLTRIDKAVETGGESEFNRLRQQWLNNLKPSPLPGEQAVTGFLQKIDKHKYLLTRPEGKWWTWSRSRQEWLDRSWRHDWHTQPRDPHGRWEPGRLRSPYVPRGARRIRRARRAAARKAALEGFRGE